MGKFVSINIDKKDCKGIYLFCDTDLKEIDSSKEAEKLINNTFKLQLRTKVGKKTGKKIFTFNKNQKTFLKALEFVASQRDIIREKVKTDGTVREVKKKDINAPESNLKTFKEVVDRFMELKSISIRKSTLFNYHAALNKHSKKLHNMPINKITIDDIQDIINDMLNNGTAAGTIKNNVVMLKAFFRKQKLLLGEFEELEYPEVNNTRKYTLTLNDTKKIIKAMREYSKIDLGDGEVFYQYEEIKNIFAFSLTGRRISEILSLRVSDLNFEENTFTIKDVVSKNKKELVFEIDDYLMKALKSQARLHKIDLFNHNEDKKIFTYNKETPRVHFQSLLQAIGLPKLRLHDIRHMLASTLVQNKVPIQDISVMLGHSGIAITEARYANKNKEQATRATNAFNSIVGE